ncbi:hypothetical protein C8J57DRAFT_1234245 [Mycena rebaudengoi]|nr:hypothetical protein C8J57DRAFT_1234245 [Mycena rebaudengoi]
MRTLSMFGVLYLQGVWLSELGPAILIHHQNRYSDASKRENPRGQTGNMMYESGSGPVIGRREMDFNVQNPIHYHLRYNPSQEWKVIRLRIRRLQFVQAGHVEKCDLMSGFKVSFNSLNCLPEQNGMKEFQRNAYTNPTQVPDVEKTLLGDR